MYERLQDGKYKISFMAPCIGIGGADALMLGLIRYAHNLHCTGIAIGDQAKIKQVQWAQNAMGFNCPIHQLQHDAVQYPGVQYHVEYANAVYAASMDADIIISWCMPQIANHLEAIDKPIIELAQNTDEYAQEICAENDSVVDFRIACSRSAVEAFPQHRREEVKVIYNGIDPGRVTPKYGRERTRDFWNVEEDQKIILFMGRYVDEKNPNQIINALKELPENWLALFVGRGYRKGDLWKKAQDDLSDPTRVRFMEPEYHVGDFLEACDVFVLPSDFEGHPLALCEAWTAGIPTVVTEMPVIQEMRETFGTMSTYLSGTPTGREIAAACHRAVSESPEVLEEVNRARFVAWHNFTLPKIATIWEEVIAQSVTDWRRKKRRPDMFCVNPRQQKTSSKTFVQQVRVS